MGDPRPAQGSGVMTKGCGWTTLKQPGLWETGADVTHTEVGEDGAGVPGAEPEPVLKDEKRRQVAKGSGQLFRRGDQNGREPGSGHVLP